MSAVTPPDEAAMPDAIDIEELTKLVTEAYWESGPLTEEQARARLRLRPMAPRLAQRVVADAERIADLVADIRNGDEAAAERLRQVEESANKASRTMSEQHLADATKLREVREALEGEGHGDGGHPVCDDDEPLRCHGWLVEQCPGCTALAKLGATK